MSIRARAVLFATFTAIAASVSPAQPAPGGVPAAPEGVSGAPGSPEQQAAPQDRRPESVHDLPAQVRLGLRVSIVDAKVPARSAVVVTPDANAYIDAIGSWTIEARFPVLIDDGTDEARENIARFIRAFQPASVIRWAGAAAKDGEGAKASIRERADLAVARAWGASKPEGLAERWSALEFTPPGACAAAERDPAWTGALALAAGRGQPILWLDRAGPESLGGVMLDSDVAAFRATVESKLDETGIAWRAMGDGIEALALCLNMPTKVSANGQILAITDCLGRIDGEPVANNMAPRAYAVGLVPGDEQTAAYRAMCALFLRPKKAWLFEGYATDPNDPKTAGFAQYALAPGVDLLKQAGFEIVVDDEPRDALGAWRRRVAAGVDAGLVHVNSSGAREWFLLKGGRAEGADVPVALEQPAIVHFIHSFSAQDPADANSIAARWLASGAYAYVGSVDEPFLTAFHSAERLFARLFALAPLSSAARVDAPQRWKINIFGDPLLIVRAPNDKAFGPPPAARLPDPPTLAGAEAWTDRMKAALKERRLDEAARALVMLGRDADVIKLFESAKSDKSQPVAPGLASAAFWAAGRAGFAEFMFDAFERLSAPQQSAQQTIDALWQWGRGALEGSPTPEMIGSLRTRLRAPTLADDAVAVAKAIRRVEGADAAREFCNSVVSGIADPAAREKAQERLRIF